jgi:hypothetical protein
MSSTITVGDPIPVAAGPSRPVFVVGMNGSGTSMLADCLGQHSALFAAYNETKILPYFLLNTGKFGNLDNDENFLKLWQTMAGIPVFTQMNGWTPLRLPSNWQDFPRNLPAIIDAIFRSIALKDNKQRWLEKTPQYIQHMPLLARSFPQAKFVHIVRDGRDCAASFHRRWRRSPEYTIYRWKRVLNEGRSQGRILGDRYFELTYEDITADPERWLRKVCEFVELPFEEAVLSSNQPHKKGIGKGASGSIQPNSKKWRAYFTKKQIAALEEIAGESLCANGYEIMHSKGDKDPSPVLRFYWNWRDRLTQFYDTSARKLSGETKKVPWSRIWNKVRTSIRQSRANRI